MTRHHYFNKLAWEAVTTLSLAIVAASLIGMFLTGQTHRPLGLVALGIGTLLLGASLAFRAILLEKEDIPHE